MSDKNKPKQVKQIITKKGFRTKVIKMDENKLEAMARILKAGELTKDENKVKRRAKINKFKINKLCSKVYGFNLRLGSKWFRKMMYNVYSEDCALKDFSGFHGLAITKCSIMDTNWKNYLLEDGSER